MRFNAFAATNWTSKNIISDTETAKSVSDNSGDFPLLRDKIENNTTTAITVVARIIVNSTLRAFLLSTANSFRVIFMLNAAFSGLSAVMICYESSSS